MTFGAASDGGTPRPRFFQKWERVLPLRTTRTAPIGRLERHSSMRLFATRWIGSVALIAWGVTSCGGESDAFSDDESGGDAGKGGTPASTNGGARSGTGGASASGSGSGNRGGSGGQTSSTDAGEGGVVGSEESGEAGDNAGIAGGSGGSGAIVSGGGGAGGDGEESVSGGKGGAEVGAGGSPLGPPVPPGKGEKACPEMQPEPNAKCGPLEMDRECEYPTGVCVCEQGAWLCDVESAPSP